MSNKNKIQLAREFRKNPTRSEGVMWNMLRGRQFMNLKFRRQHLIDGYIIDFYCHELLLAVEIDGKVHETMNKIKEDIQRQKIIEKNNIKFFRVKSEDVEYNPEEVLKRLKLFINDTRI